MKSVMSAMTEFNSSWNNSLKAFDLSTGEWGSNKGYMGMEAFYNMTNMMNQLAGMAGSNLVIAGQTLDGSATSMSLLINKAFNTLKVLEDGSTVIDLGAIGMNFEMGAE